MSSVHRLTAAALVLAALTACSSSDGGRADVPAPRPSGAAATACRQLAGELPRRVDGLRRRDTEPDSRFTAAWGDPAVRLRCGVPRPKVLTPGTEHYNPTAEAAGVNGVDWLLEKQDGGYRFTTTGRRAFVEVTVPGKYAPEIGALTDLAKAVRQAVPKASL